MSPDKKWFWDGARWQPIPVHEAAFPNWKGLGAGFTPESAAPAPVAPALRRDAAPVPAYRMAGPAPDVAAPNWNVRPPMQARVRKYGVLAAGAAVLIALVALASVLATLALTAKSPTAAVTTTHPKAGPTSRSDSAWATYLVKSLTAPMAEIKDTTALTRTACVQGMTSSCADTFVALDNSLNGMIRVLEQATIPLCIATQETKLAADLKTMIAGEQLAYKGFHDNKKSEFSTGLGQVNGTAGAAQSDFAALSAAAGRCDTQITGP
jgi:hypothetical protein